MMRVMCLLPLVLGAQFLSSQEQAMGVPAFDKVLTMLQNLKTQLDAEATADDADYQAFLSWFDEQQKGTSSSVTALTAKIQELGAALTDLRARSQTLTTEVHDLNVEIDRETGALQEATEKRQSEHDAFVQEQLDFDNAIAACGKAAELLTAHYGDGKPKESTKPAWMTLSQLYHTIDRLAKKRGRRVPALLQQPVDFFNSKGSSLHDTYEPATEEGVGIVGEIQALAQTFAEDKQSSIDQENDLKSAFETLAAQKKAMIASVTGQRDQQQGVLNSVNQQVAEHDGAQTIAQTTLQNEQAYLTSLAQQEKDTTELYNRRKKDREDEKEAVDQAHKVLQEAVPALLQLKRSHSRRALLQVESRKQTGCRNCGKAAALLKTRALKLHSELLATTAASLGRKNGGSLMATGSTQSQTMAGSNSALAPVVEQLEGLVARLDQEAASEEKHKEWCVTERTNTVQKRDRHAGIVADLQKSISNLNDVIGDKNLALQDNGDAITRADNDYADLQNLREKAKSDFEAELQDYQDAIAALNQASEMLTEFYKSSEALMETRVVVRRQAPEVPDAFAKSDTPGMGSLSGEYEQKGGPAGVLSVLANTRQEFETGMAALQESEQQQQAEFQASTTSYKEARNALVAAKNQLTVELQTAEASLAADEQNLKANEAEVASTNQYLSQVSASCDSLEAHFDDRQALRGQERTALQDAIKVLQTS